MKQSLSIRWRLLIGFCVVLLPFVAALVVVLDRLDTLTSHTKALVERQAHAVALTTEINQHSHAAALHLLRVLQTTDRGQRVPLYASIDDEHRRADTALMTLEEVGTSGAKDAALQHLLGLRKQFIAAFLTTVELIELVDLGAARQHFNQQTNMLLEELLKATQMVAKQQQDSMQASMIQMEADARQARILLLVLTLGALLTSGVAIWLISRSIIGPIRTAVDVAQKVSIGQYTSALPSNAGPEMGVLLSALQTMRNSIASREQHISRLAYTDALTKLPNLTRLLQDFEQVLEHQQVGALLLINVNRFAAINNALGHAVGDQVIKGLGLRLRHSTADSHLVARVGGDEFAILLKGASDAKSVQFAQELCQHLRAPMQIGTQHLDVDVRIGMVLFPGHGSQLTVLMRLANRAIQWAKGRYGGFVLGSDLPGEIKHEQLGLIGEMRQALAEDQFEPYFQPKLELSSGRVVGVEALLRWNHPQKGLIPPVGFIPFAEQTGFIRDITQWMLQKVIHEAGHWHRNGLELVTCINLSVLDLELDTLPSTIQSLLQQAGLPAHLLCLEITESALMLVPEDALRQLHALAAFKVKLSIDDYGTGQASLAYVQQLPAHELKLDRAFVTHVDRNAKNAAIVRSTILLCKDLGMSMVAEGTETQEELQWLAQNGCDIVQGYAVGKPMPGPVFLDWLGKRK